MSPFQKPSGDKRGAYRVNARDRARLVVAAAAGPVEGRIIDISSGGAGVQFEGAARETLSQGASFALRIVLGIEGERRLFLRGTVRSIAELGRSDIRVGIEFEQTERLFPQLDPATWRYFNRRAALRVPPRDEGAERLIARVTLDALKGTQHIALVDISALGIALDGETAPKAITPGLRVRARFEFDGRVGKRELGLVVFHRTQLSSGGERIGLAIDEGTTLLVDAQRDEIHDWALARERGLVRQK